jgi:dihydroorotase
VGFSDDGKAVASSRVLRNALDYSRMFDKPIIEHCEDAELASGGVMNEGLVASHLGLRGISNAVEEIIVARDIALAELTGGWLHVAHVSTAGSVELIRQAKKRGVRVTSEVTPHHLLLTEEWVGGRRGTWSRSAPYSTSTKVNPPLRTERDRQALVDGLKDGTIDAVATDHAPHSVPDKLCEYDLAPFGISGLETALGELLTLVNRGELELQFVVEKLTSSPAKLLGGLVGTLAPQAVADITVFAPHSEWTVDVSTFASKGWNSPFDGLRLPGRVAYTLVGGALVYDGRNNEREGNPSA